MNNTDRKPGTRWSVRIGPSGESRRTNGAVCPVGPTGSAGSPAWERRPSLDYWPPRSRTSSSSRRSTQPTSSRRPCEKSSWRWPCTAWAARNGRAYIINEAHGLRRDTIRQLLVVLERLPDYVVFIFTTMLAGEATLFGDQIDAHPLLSRCIVLPLSDDVGDDFAQRVAQIANTEGLDGLDIDAYRRLGRKVDYNMRAMLQAVESGDVEAPDEECDPLADVIGTLVR